MARLLLLSGLATLLTVGSQLRPSLSPWCGAGILTEVERREALSLVAQPASGHPRTEAEYRAYFIYALALVTEWPQDAFPDPRTPFSIGILGPPEPMPELDALQGRTVKGHPIVLVRARTVESLVSCHLVYVTAASGDLPLALKALRGRPVLTVGEQENHTQLGGMVRCNPAENLLPSEVNVRVAKESRLSFRSQFLKMVTRVAY